MSNDQRDQMIKTVRDQVPAVVELGTMLGVSGAFLVHTIATQCFKNPKQPVTATQVAAYILVATEFRKLCPNFNPLLPRMMYAFSVKDSDVAIEPMLGPAGVHALLRSTPGYRGFKLTEEFDEQGKIHAVVANIRLVDMDPFEYRAYLSEWKRPTGPWNQQPTHMLGLKALKYCASYVIAGLPVHDPEDVIEAQIIDTTPVPTKGDQLRDRMKVLNSAEAPVFDDRDQDRKAEQDKQDMEAIGKRAQADRDAKAKAKKKAAPVPDPDPTPQEQPMGFFGEGQDDGEIDERIRFGSNAFLNGHSLDDNPYPSEDDDGNPNAAHEGWRDDYEQAKAGE